MRSLAVKILMCLCLLCGLTAGVPAAEAGLISREQEIEMGRSYGQELEARYGVVQDPLIQERLDKIGQRLAKVSGRTDIEYSFKVLNNDEVNALACPGGFIYVYRGLLDYMSSDAELAGVLGHEIGHVAKKHTVHAMEKQLWTTILMIAATKGMGWGLAQMLQQALLAGYSRTDERGADKESVRNTIEAGFNPYSMLIAAFKLEDLAAQEGAPNYGLFSSHPEPEERIRRVLKQLAPYNIKPTMSVTADKHAIVSEDDWSFSVTQDIGSTKAEYRAYLLAGALWQVRRQGEIEPYRFVVYDNGAYAHIYYDDIQLHTIYRQDTDGRSAGAYAAAVVDKFKLWAEMVNKKPQTN